MFIDLKADLTLGHDEADVYDYVATITGRLYTFADSGKKRTIGHLRGWKVQLDKIDADGGDIWEVLDAEHGELEALYSAVFDVQSGAFKPAVLRIANLERAC